MMHGNYIEYRKGSILYFTKQMKKAENISKKKLKTELKLYEKQGVVLKLEDRKMSPKEIARACFAAEEGSYTRDYVCDEDGELKMLCFNLIKENK